MGFSSFPRSAVLLLGPNSIHSLLPVTLIDQAESLLADHRLQQAVALADRQRAKLHNDPYAEPDEVDALRYVYQRIGVQCLKETLFSEAAEHLVAGELDPRILISYFPDLRDLLADAPSSIDLFAGVAEHMPKESSIDEMIIANIVLNYAPHLPPSAHSTTELNNLLLVSARDMLTSCLRRQRGVKAPTAVRQVVDNALTRLYAQSGDTKALNALLQTPHSVLLPLVEQPLLSSSCLRALCTLYEQAGDYRKLLHTYSRIVDGEWKDGDVRVEDALGAMFAILEGRNGRERGLVAEWGVWLTKKDPARAVKLLTKDAHRRKDKSQEDVSMLEQIAEADPAAGHLYLEYLVLQKRSSTPQLHTRLATTYISQVLSDLSKPSILKLWRAKASTYPRTTSFLSYFLSTTPDSPEKRTRLKTVLFLQGSTGYDARLITRRVEEGGHEKASALALERAILHGKLGEHRAALKTLVHELGDALAAEAYCSYGGSAVPPSLVSAISEACGLQAWAPPSSVESVSGEETRALMRVLLEVYVELGDEGIDRARMFLERQGSNLDDVDVITSIPLGWPLTTLSTFLTRSFRGSLHCRHEGQITKALSAGQNLAVFEETWLVLREQGAVIEEEEEEEDEKSVIVLDEKA